MKKIKHLQCKDCGNEYTHHSKWVDKHARKFKHFRFRAINQEIKCQT